MKQLVGLLIFSCFIISCQIEDDNAPAPNESFTKYYGELTSYEAKDIEIILDAGGVPTGFVVFGTVLVDQGNRDFFVMTTDLDGNLLDSAQYGFGVETRTDWTGDGIDDSFIGDEAAGQIEVVPGFGYLIVGTSTIDEPSAEPEPISDLSLLSFGAIDLDLNILRGPDDSDSLTVIPGDANLELDLIGNDVIVLSDNSILLVGAREFNRGGGVTDFDNYFLRLSDNPGDSFEESQGIAGDGQDEQVVRAFEKADGTLVMIGYNNRPSALGENNGDNGTNAYYLEIDPNGSVPGNGLTYGIDDGVDNVRFDDVVTSAISTESGFVIAGTSTTSQGQDFGFVMNLSRNGVHLSNSTLPSSFDGIQTRVNGLTLADDKDVVLVGQYPSFNATVNGQALSKSGEGLFMKVDQSSNPIAGYETNFGLTDGNDQIVDAVTLPDGKIVAVANVDFGGGVQLISIIKLNDSGNLED